MPGVRGGGYRRGSGESVDAWVEPSVYRRVEDAAKRVGGQFLKPVFEALNGDVSYEEIRVVVRHAGLM